MSFSPATAKAALHFARPRWEPRLLACACANGSSEMVSNLSVAVTTFLFNLLMMRALGEDGVAAITIVLYSQFLFTAVFLGYVRAWRPSSASTTARGTTPKPLGQLFRLSLIFIAVCSLLAWALSLALSQQVVSVFAKRGEPVFDLAVHGLFLFSAGFLFMGFNIFASGLFTALSNGRVSAILSFLRTFVFIVAAILLLPRLLGVDGIWLSIPAAEALALLVSAWYMVRLKPVYGY